MRHVAAGATLVVIMVGAGACSGGGEGDGNGKAERAKTAAPKASATPAPSLTPVALPEDDPAGLVALIGKQVRAARTMKANVVVKSGKGKKTEQERMSGVLRTDTNSPAAQLKIVELDEAYKKESKKNKSKKKRKPKEVTTHVVVEEGVFYTRVEGEDQAKGKPWIKLSREGVRKQQLGPFVKIFSKYLDEADRALREVSADTGLSLVENGEFEGSPTDDTLSGAPVRRFEGTTETKVMADNGEEGYKSLHKAGLDKVRWTLWVDDTGLPHRFVVTLDMPGGEKATSTSTYDEWTRPITLEKPPPDEVATLEDV